MYWFFTIELRRRVRYVNYHANRTSPLPAKRTESERRFGRRREAKGTEKSGKVRFDKCFHVRDDRSSSICVFACRIDVAVRYVFLRSEWTGGPPKGPKCDNEVDFDTCFHDRTARDHFGRKNTYQNVRFNSNDKTLRNLIDRLSPGLREGWNSHSLSIRLSKRGDMNFVREFTYPNAPLLDVESVRL